MREITLSTNAISQKNTSVFSNIKRHSTRGVAPSAGLGLVGTIIGLFIALVVAEINKDYSFNRHSSLTGPAVNITAGLTTGANPALTGSAEKDNLFYLLLINHSGSSASILSIGFTTYSSGCGANYIPKETVNIDLGV